MDKHGTNLIDGGTGDPGPSEAHRTCSTHKPDEDRTLQTDDDASPQRSKMPLYPAMTTLHLTLSMAALDITSLATSIPTITAELNSAAGYSWIGGAFLIADAASGPIWAKASDIYGRKLAIRSALAFFAVASVIRALSTTMNMLIAARAIQGAGAGGMVSLVNITVSDSFGLSSGRALILGTLEAVWAVAGGAGPMIGGAVTENIGWRWNFWINRPIVGVAVLLVIIFLGVHNPRTPFWIGIAAVDWYGIEFTEHVDCVFGFHGAWACGRVLHQAQENEP
ncbi:Putative major facilitator superfamily, MFS transporter superfamily [Septoria linicola]|uniref:Major facilitator superfamily, MFS transporter superfamily n=1 Tax=Septoria linicola TaxID=215465 RepID=A0A9Q9EIY3_9PEZI|nr:putative major facilitator superfamily, MFS transporter superfamily [Septoria linicola]USW53251.1 Putative major facilitator superfamily, MFS transporter superfamily [Septoria linicola]